MTVQPARLDHSSFALSRSSVLAALAFGATYRAPESAPAIPYEAQDEDEVIDDDEDDDEDEDGVGTLDEGDDADEEEDEEEDEDEEVEDEE